jgi:SAM-dependent methyltransferase
MDAKTQRTKNASPPEGAEDTLVQLRELLQDDSLEVIRDIAPHDGMYEYGPEIYFEAGQAALRCIRLAMLAAGRETVDSVLDFGAGAGRVLRYLKAGFPGAALTAADILGPHVAFCERVLGAKGVVSKPNPGEIELEGPFDVIWAGSVLTHIDEERWLEFVKLWESLLSPGGVLVFTVYGRFIAEMLRSGATRLNLTEEQVGEVLAGYEARGFGFHTTPPDGDALVSRAWVCTQLDQAPELELLLYTEHAWLSQDVVACTKATA